MPSYAQLLISNTGLVKEVLNNRDKTYVRPEFPGDIKKILGDGLVSTEGKKWTRQRRLAHLAFHGESLKFTAIMSEVIFRTAFGSSYTEGRDIFQMLGEKKLNIGEMDDYVNDFLGSLLKAYHNPDESKQITIDDLVDECKTFYFVGQETTNSILTWTLFFLAIHKDWQEEARKEVADVVGNEDPNFEGIMKLKTVGMVINETLRLYHPVINIIRKIHHDPRIWADDVHLFKPERFSEGIPKATNNNAAAFLPFGLGPAEIAIAMILQHYSFTLSPDYIHLPTQILIMRPQHGVKVILHPL
ncbi:hypothetical protein EUGRSUZ_B01979 [Eucalyptus grandis]|uniref:Uncharacterized protein n=2 Tax=Eucalyptus grandis TaxID=71139 RepID=A0ACC3LRY5_EUCGR|nr:hypothetical protein EUGRSUZ_B01979 [Eucalyptus grandis]